MRFATSLFVTLASAATLVSNAAGQATNPPIVATAPAAASSATKSQAPRISAPWHARGSKVSQARVHKPGPMQGGSVTLERIPQADLARSQKPLPSDVTNEALPEDGSLSREHAASLQTAKPTALEAKSARAIKIDPRRAAIRSSASTKAPGAGSTISKGQPGATSDAALATSSAGIGAVGGSAGSDTATYTRDGSSVNSVASQPPSTPVQNKPTGQPIIARSTKPAATPAEQPSVAFDDKPLDPKKAGRAPRTRLDLMTRISNAEHHSR